jgi:hypothetical protein
MLHLDRQWFGLKREAAAEGLYCAGPSRLIDIDRQMLMTVPGATPYL